MNACAITQTYFLQEKRVKVPTVGPGPGLGRAAGRGVAPPIGAAPVGMRKT